MNLVFKRTLCSLVKKKFINKFQKRSSQNFRWLNFLNQSLCDCKLSSLVSFSTRMIITLSKDDFTPPEIHSAINFPFCLILIFFLFFPTKNFYEEFFSDQKKIPKFTKKFFENSQFSAHVLNLKFMTKISLCE